MKPLLWTSEWADISPDLAARCQFDWIVASDVVYGTACSLPLARLLLDLLARNPAAMGLLAYERRWAAAAPWRPGVIAAPCQV